MEKEGKNENILRGDLTRGQKCYNFAFAFGKQRQRPRGRRVAPECKENNEILPQDRAA